MFQAVMHVKDAFAKTFKNDKGEDVTYYRITLVSALGKEYENVTAVQDFSAAKGKSMNVFLDAKAKAVNNKVVLDWRVVSLTDAK